MKHLPESIVFLAFVNAFFRYRFPKTLIVCRVSKWIFVALSCWLVVVTYFYHEVSPIFTQTPWLLPIDSFWIWNATPFTVLLLAALTFYLVMRSERSDDINHNIVSCWVVVACAMAMLFCGDLVFLFTFIGLGVAATHRFQKLRPINCVGLAMIGAAFLHIYSKSTMHSFILDAIIEAPVLPVHQSASLASLLLGLIFVMVGTREGIVFSFGAIGLVMRLHPALYMQETIITQQVLPFAIPAIAIYFACTALASKETSVIRRRVVLAFLGVSLFGWISSPSFSATPSIAFLVAALFTSLIPKPDRIQTHLAITILATVVGLWWLWTMPLAEYAVAVVGSTIAIVLAIYSLFMQSEDAPVPAIDGEPDAA